MIDPCLQFHKNPSVNPRTSRKIKIGGPVYKSLVRECGPPGNLSTTNIFPGLHQQIQPVIAKQQIRGGFPLFPQLPTAVPQLPIAIPKQPQIGGFPLVPRLPIAIPKQPQQPQQPQQQQQQQQRQQIGGFPLVPRLPIATPKQQQQMGGFPLVPQLPTAITKQQLGRFPLGPQLPSAMPQLPTAIPKQPQQIGVFPLVPRLPSAMPKQQIGVFPLVPQLPGAMPQLPTAIPKQQQQQIGGFPLVPQLPTVSPHNGSYIIGPTSPNLKPLVAPTSPKSPALVAQSPLKSPGLVPQSPLKSPGSVPQSPLKSPGLVPQSPLKSPGLVPQPPLKSPGLVPQSPLKSSGLVPQSPLKSPGLVPQSPLKSPGLLGQNNLKVLTVNVQSYDTCGLNRICEQMFDKIIKIGADVICFQEDLESQQNELEGYMLVSTCKAEPLYESYLVNRIFVNNKLINYVEDSREFEITQGCNVPRCAAFIRIKGISIVNLHMCGGKFDDPGYAELLEVKKNEINRIFENLGYYPDLIIGDFNSENTKESVLISLTNSKYPLFYRMNQNEKEKFVDYLTSHIGILSDAGYKSAYTVDQVGPTSKFGGTPDWFYYQDTHLTPISVETIPLLDYTDHNGVLVTFQIN